MSGVFNSEFRDYCGEESPIAKLSNHFSKDFGFHQAGINNNNNQTSNSVVKSFNFNELLKEVINQKSNLPISNEKQEKSNNLLKSIENKHNIEEVSINNRNSFYKPSRNFFQTSNFTIPFNLPASGFIPPDESVVAKAWAENELAKFDEKIIDEELLKQLIEEQRFEKETSSHFRFTDVLQDMVKKEDQDEIDLFDEILKKDVLYDLDEDLKNMREKLDSNIDDINVWNQIEKSLSQYGDVNKKNSNFIFNKSNHYLNKLENLKTETELNKRIEEILSQGVEFYKTGYFSKAILAFEAVVQIRPFTEVGWSYLAMSLSENEQDHKAIIACNKCLELNKNNRDALLSLARVHCNEMNISATIACLEQWMIANPKYSDLVTVGQEAIHSYSEKDSSFWEDIYEFSAESSGKFSIIDEQFKCALNRNSVGIDPELEIAAGTLYHAVQDYAKATAHFEAAVSIMNDNASLWNKLGTSYCNDKNYEKAINTYRKALEFAPAFARAECNLGVAYYNQECYKEAIEHAIRAVKIQSSENVHNNDNILDYDNQSDPIWTLIRMSSFKLGRFDLDLSIFNRDIEILSKEFCV